MLRRKAKLIFSSFFCRQVAETTEPRIVFPNLEIHMIVPPGLTHADLGHVVVFTEAGTTLPSNVDEIQMPESSMLLMFTLSETTVHLISFASDLTVEQRMPEAAKLFEQATLATPLPRTPSLPFLKIDNMLSFMTTRGIVSVGLFVKNSVNPDKVRRYVALAEAVLASCEMLMVPVLEGRPTGPSVAPSNSGHPFS